MKKTWLKILGLIAPVLLLTWCTLTQVWLPGEREYEWGGFTYVFDGSGAWEYIVWWNANPFTYTDNWDSFTLIYTDTNSTITLNYTIDWKVLNVKDSAWNDTLYNRVKK